MTPRIVVFITLAIGLLAAPAYADSTEPRAGGDAITVISSKGDQGGQEFPSDTGSGPSGGTRPVALPAYRTEYRPACELRSDAASGCANITAGCPEGQIQYREWDITPTSETPLSTLCLSPDQATTAPPQVTPGMVLEAFRRIPVPSLRSITQPGDKTLVNFETIFYAEADPFTETVTLLGQSVRLEIEPSTFTWHHGDGTTTTTTTPGAPYPAKTVTHAYADAHTTVQHHLTVTWTARWSLNGGPLQPVPGTVTTTGPLTPLRIAEAVPALSGQRTR